jgi:DNA-binding Xre family transcriptional regulator
MEFYDAFNKTLKRFDLKAGDLARKTDLSMQRVSQFKTGFNVRLDTLQKLLEVMPQEARRHMLLLVAEGETTDSPPSTGG